MAKQFMLTSLSKLEESPHNAGQAAKIKQRMDMLQPRLPAG